MTDDELKWRRFFGGVLIGGPAAVAVIALVLSGQPSALLISAAIFLIPMLLGAWLLLGKPQ